jgi:tetratricopeptide (TPR) repeat protein
LAQFDWLDLLGWTEDEIESLRYVGYSYIKQGDYATAITLFKALLILTENNAYDFQTLGAIYLEKGEPLQALNYLEKALKIDPLNTATLLNRAKALFLLGYKKQGKKECQSLSLNKDKNIANEASALLLSFA